MTSLTAKAGRDPVRRFAATKGASLPAVPPGSGFVRAEVRAA